MKQRQKEKINGEQDYGIEFMGSREWGADEIVVLIIFVLFSKLLFCWFLNHWKGRDKKLQEAAKGLLPLLSLTTVVSA